MEFIIFIAWITFSLYIGILGDYRKIGFWRAFLLSLVLSPLIGFVITLFSKTLKQQRLDDELLENQKEQTRLLAEKSSNSISIVDELEKLAKLKDRGLITESEFQLGKEKLLNSR